ncbi:hypothetical protein RN001_000179 [Aquatica leii]|uniref:Uncharacterized protein n=1 Tax=Aquatica leii TaxID=1421715 RepID=A0AAN7QLW7_9COLE|nr:hypothetical protein RN001_000179 [Aquatica leii]
MQYEAISIIHIKPDIDDCVYQEVDDKGKFSIESDSDSPNKNPTEHYNSKTDVTDIIESRTIFEDMSHLELEEYSKTSVNSGSVFEINFNAGKIMSVKKLTLWFTENKNRLSADRMAQKPKRYYSDQELDKLFNGSDEFSGSEIEDCVETDRDSDNSRRHSDQIIKGPSYDYDDELDDLTPPLIVEKAQTFWIFGQGPGPVVLCSDASNIGSSLNSFLGDDKCGDYAKIITKLVHTFTRADKVVSTNDEEHARSKFLVDLLKLQSKLKSKVKQYTKLSQVNSSPLDISMTMSSTTIESNSSDESSDAEVSPSNVTQLPGQVSQVHHQLICLLYKSTPVSEWRFTKFSGDGKLLLNAILEIIEEPMYFKKCY